jgi:predicted nucleotide-binding protein
MNPDISLEIDHINRDGCDNRRSNLRICNRSQNNMNKTKYKNNTSNFKCVSFDKKRNKWKAYTKFNNRSIFIGYYSTPEDAALAYDLKAIELFGEFANLNFPLDS